MSAVGGGASLFIRGLGWIVLPDWPTHFSANRLATGALIIGHRFSKAVAFSSNRKPSLLAALGALQRPG